MRKSIHLILLLIFIFANKGNGQSEGKLVKKIFERFKEGTFQKVYHEYYAYRENGDLLSVRLKRFYPNGDILSEQGYFYDYDANDKLVKVRNRRYNPNVDLWITNNWTEYFYNDGGCLIREDWIDNLQGFQNSLFYEVDEDCKILERRITDELDYNLYVEYIYPDENNSLITIEYDLDSIGWNERIKTEVIRNERGDVVRRETLLRNDLTPPDDTAYLKLQFYEYEYIEDINTGYLNSKFERYSDNFSNIFILPPLIILKSERRFDYEYYCDGLVSIETVRYVGESDINWRKLYFYEGKNDCFDFEQDLEMTISPNPSSGEIEIQSLIFESGDTELLVFTAGGQLIFEKFIPSRSHYQNLDLNDLENGVYFIQLRNGKHFSTSKLVITQ